MPIPDSDTALLHCSGAPRDLGLDQARWCRSSLTSAFWELSLADRLRLRLGRTSPQSARVGRDLRRHFPQQFEAIEGMARGAGLPVSWFVEKLAQGAHPAPHDWLAFAASGDWTGGASLLACTLPQDAIVRRSHPDGGFASVELIAPWSTAPSAGINDAGLAVVAFCDEVEPASTAAGGAGCAAPATLFAHDCLARFDALEGAVDWCLARPGGGAATLLFADRSGEVAAVEVRGEQRRVTRPADGVIVRTAAHAREAEIGKALRQASPLMASDLGRFLGVSLVALDPEACRLGLLHASDGDTSERWCTPQRDESDRG